MRVVNCEGCEHKEDNFNQLFPLQINIGCREKTYMLCPTCHEKDREDY